MSFDKKRSHEQTSLSGNGDTYTGKITAQFLHTDISNPCHKLSKSGKPFPDQQISMINGEAFFVREKCQDFATPQPLALSEYELDANRSSILFRGEKFDITPNLADYYLIPAVCRPGQTPVSQPVNQFQSPFDYTASAWTTMLDVAVGYFGVFDVLPRFQILRTADSNPWERVNNSITLANNAEFAFSFLVERGNTPRASVRYWVTDLEQFEVQLDFTNGRVTLPWIDGVDNVQAAARPYGRGFVIDAFFRTRVAPGGHFAAIGPHPVNTTDQAGDYVFSTAASLYDTSSYCQ